MEIGGAIDGRLDAFGELNGIQERLAIRGLPLRSARVEPAALTDAGFTFDHPELEPALAAVLDRR